MIRRLTQRAGHRGAFLFLIALRYITYGFALLTSHASLNAYRLLLPVHVWAIIWLLAGVIVLGGVFVNHDRVYFGIAAAIPAAWAVAFIHAWYAVPPTKTWENAALWIITSALVMVVSSWPEAPSKPPRDKESPSGYQHRR